MFPQSTYKNAIFVPNLTCRRWIISHCTRQEATFCQHTDHSHRFELSAFKRSSKLTILLPHPEKRVKMIRMKPSVKFLKSNPYAHLGQVFKSCSDRRPHLGDVGSIASILRSREVVRFRVPDTVKFLQGLVTNDVSRFGEPSNFPTPNLPEESNPPVYAALLTPRGRFLYDLFIYQHPRTEQKLARRVSGPENKRRELELLLDVDATVSERLVATFINLLMGYLSMDAQSKILAKGTFESGQVLWGIMCGCYSGEEL